MNTFDSTIIEEPRQPVASSSRLPVSAPSRPEPEPYESPEFDFDCPKWLQHRSKLKVDWTVKFDEDAHDPRGLPTAPRSKKVPKLSWKHVDEEEEGWTKKLSLTAVFQGKAAEGYPEGFENKDGVLNMNKSK